MVDIRIENAGKLAGQLKAYIAKMQSAAVNTVDRTAEDIRFKTDWTYATAAGDTDTRVGPIGAEYGVEKHSLGDMEAEVVADGEATFLEFGAGIHFNGAGNHPKQAELGISMGMYGKHQGLRDAWWVSKNWRSYGTPATQGMYNAFQEARDNVEDVMREELEK